jgi:SAM-dependent methyltransferase
MSAIKCCRACGSTSLAPILDLGNVPLANGLLTREALSNPETRYPLALVMCPACSLVQITETVPPELLFGEYFYFSSFSDEFVRHAQTIAQRMITERQLGPSSLVLELASNDGYMLQHYVQAGVPVLGIEPARNIAAVANERGILTRNEFFGLAFAEVLALEGVRADVVHANNVLAHVADLPGFVAGIKRVLAPGGMAVIEAPYVKDLVEHIEFDTIYHEHLCYFSLTAVDRLMRLQGLRVVDVEHLSVHGGSLRYFVTHDGTPSIAVDQMLAVEAAWGVSLLAVYNDLAHRVDRLRVELKQLLEEIKGGGARIVAYGASAKGSTLLAAFGIGRETLEYVVDRSTVKQGLFTPGTHLEICSPERLLVDMPPYVLLLSWNFAAEILAQQQLYRDRGGRFIVPLPTPRIL